MFRELLATLLFAVADIIYYLLGEKRTSPTTPRNIIKQTESWTSLPPEIRLLIYNKILPKNVVSILYKDANIWRDFWGSDERLPTIPQVPPHLFRLNRQIRHEVYHELSKRRFVVSQSSRSIMSTENRNRGIPTGLRHCMREVVLDATVLCEPRIPVKLHQFRINRLTLRLTNFIVSKWSSLYGPERIRALRLLCVELYPAVGQGAIREMRILVESVKRDAFMDILTVLGLQKVLPILFVGEEVNHALAKYRGPMRLHWERVQRVEASHDLISRRLVFKTNV